MGGSVDARIAKRMNELTTFMELLHWIVASIGLSETILILLLGLVWSVYTVWTRSNNPPRGAWRWGIWIPLAYCLEGVRGGIAAKWELYNLMMTAGAFNEPQLDLYIKQSVFGVIKMLTLGIAGTLFIRATIRSEPAKKAETS